MARKGYSLGSLTDYVNTKFNITGGEITGSMNVQGVLNEKGQRVYSPNNKPTSGDVNAVSKSGDDVNGQLRCTPTFASTTANAHIFHDCRGTDMSPVNLRSMRESPSSAWIWEKVAGGKLRWSTGTNGGGTDKIWFDVNYGMINATGNIQGSSVYALGSGDSHVRVENTASKKKLQFVSRDNGGQTVEVYSPAGNWQYPVTFRDDGGLEFNNVTVKGATFAMKGDGRKHINFQRSNGSSDGFIYKDVGEPWCINHGETSPAWWRFTPKGEFVVNAKHWGDTHGHAFADIDTTAPIHLSYDGVGGVSDYYPMIRGRHSIPSRGYNTNFDFGFLRSNSSVVGGWDGAAVIRVAGNERTSDPNANFMFYISGDFNAQRNGNFNDVYIRSDASLKKNMQPLQSSLEGICKLEPCEYDKRMVESEEYTIHEEGLIAQAVEEIFPNAVDTNPNTGLKSLKPYALIARLIGAVKELSEKVEELERQLEAK